MGDRKYFGTDGIRGRVGEWPITAEFMLKLGRAAGTVLAGGARKATVVIGKDTRVSGYMFESALEAGLVAAGADVRLLGPMPTPAVAYLTRSLRASAGIVISASHNPHQDNGVKFFSASGEKLDDAVELAIERELEAPFATVDSEAIGKVVRMEDAAARYAEFCKSTVPASFSLRGLSIVLDCAHGATYQIAPKVFGELGAQVEAIGNRPDGLNINRDVGSTKPQALTRAVVETGADLGIAFDGDGDRLQMVDRNGHLVDGDQLLYVLAQDWHAQWTPARTLGRHADEQLRPRARDARARRAVPARERRRSLRAAAAQGERRHARRRDVGTHSLLSTARRAAMRSSARCRCSMRWRAAGKRLDEAVAGMRKIPQTTINIRVAGGAALVADADVQRVLERVRGELEGQGRVVLRPSGTEPLVRVTVEAADDAVVARLSNELAEAVKAAAAKVAA